MYRVCACVSLVLRTVIDCIVNCSYKINKGTVNKKKSVLSPRYFFQRAITKHNSVLLMGERSRSNSVEEIALQVPSLDHPFAIFIELCSCDFQALKSFTAQVKQLIDA